MEKLSTLLSLCDGNPPFTYGFPWERLVRRRFDFSLRTLCWTNSRVSDDYKHRDAHTTWPSWSVFRDFQYSPEGRQMEWIGEPKLRLIFHFLRYMCYGVVTHTYRQIPMTPSIQNGRNNTRHYNDVIMSAMASQITSLMIVYSTFYSGADQRKHHKAPRH